MLPFRDFNPSRSFPLVTISLLVLNVLVFLYMLSLEAQGGEALNTFVRRAAVVPADFLAQPMNWNTLGPAILSLFTAMFMHAGFVHLAGNMLYLWIFGNNVEDIMGPIKFLLFYLLSGIIASFAHIVSVIGNPALAQVPSLGASGAIAGVLGAYLVRFPRAQVDTCIFFFFITVIRLPALVVLAFWFILQLFQGVASVIDGTAQTGGVAIWAHIGGFLAGMIFVNFFAKRRQAGYN